MGFSQPTVTADTLIDFCISQFGNDLYSICPLTSNAADQSGNAHDFTAVGSPTFGSTTLLDSVKNTTHYKSMVGTGGAAGGKYIRRQNDSASGVVAALGLKGLTVIVIFKPDGSTTGYSNVFDFRRASGTPGRNGIRLEINNGQADGGQSTKCNVRITAAGGNSDWVEFDTAAGCDGWWNDTDTKIVRVEYRKGDVSAGINNTCNVYVNEMLMTPSSSDLNNVLTADTFTDSSTAGDYLSFDSYYAGNYGAAGNYAYATIIKRLITRDEGYAFMQAAWKTTAEGIPFALGTGYDYDVAKQISTDGTPADLALVASLSDSSGNSWGAIVNATDANKPTYQRDSLGRWGVGFDNQMQAQGGVGHWLAAASDGAPNGKYKRRGVLFCGSIMASSVLGQTFQRVVTYHGTSNSLSCALQSGRPIIDINNNVRGPSATAGIAGAADTAQALIPCVPQIGTLAWGTGWKGMGTYSTMGSDGRLSAGSTGTMAAGSYTATLSNPLVVGYDSGLSDEDGASMILYRLVDVGRPLLEQDYARFHAFMGQYYNPATAAEYSAATALYRAKYGSWANGPTGHWGVRDIGITTGGTSLECATPQSGAVTNNRGVQGRFSASFLKRVGYAHTNAIGGSLAGPDKNIDGTAQSGATLNILDNWDWTARGITGDTQRGPITHVLWLEPWTNTMARAAAAPNSGADIANYGPIQSVEEAIRRWRANNPTGLVFIQTPSADILAASGKTATAATLLAWCVARKADGTIADYLTPLAKGDLHWTDAEMAIEAARIEAMVSRICPPIAKRGINPRRSR